ncbi:MAG TPA: sigma 54-interacting transcriptional regulator [Povalibacter sp.]|uniref:sigma 54-interacting transcriptional regulator n=1 Tax=Povalibacter sp. TaxID=1962978 RepID=UPI002C392000|nr:sigma 54-interacting transcriptional regulator [Povalibacter sp.]HMN46940.1 sigma 54-interacting transcriptional regulator [Povalibacter sp.]
MTVLSDAPSSFPSSLSDADALAVARVCSVGGLLGESAAMHAMFERMAHIARLHADVLIVGENGSGKELAARCLHDLSDRATQPFLVLNCATLAPALIDSELFGYEASASEGGVARLGSQQGHLERAARGTLLLEDVAGLTPELQVKLLRALESRRSVRVGGTRELEFHCRIIATVQSDPRGALRPELLDRLSVCQLRIPPLRERGEDVELLANYFLQVLNVEEHTSKRLSPDSADCLARYDWPGNVRELRNAVHRAFILAEGDLDLGSAIDRSTPLSSIGDAECLRIPVGTPLAEAERRMILATLRKCEGNKTRAAALLGVSLKTLYNRLHAYRAQGLVGSDHDRESIEVAN